MDRTIRFAAFVNEEPPFFFTGRMGSAVYAKEQRRSGAKIAAMFSLETIGYFSDRPGSQRYPFPLRGLYPDRGCFIAFVGNLASRRLVRRSIRTFRRHARLPSEGIAAPGYLPGVFWSDQWAFWRQGYRAVMITDTAPFRYPFYHTPQDTPDKLDYDRMAHLVAGLAEVVRDLAAAER
jgi:Zn-dependent M28 family amino/carboxypeptidase